MTKKYTYKKQGDGRDSWVCEEMENGECANSYMVYEDPNIIQKVDLIKLFTAATEEEIAFIKNLFK